MKSGVGPYEDVCVMGMSEEPETIDIQPVEFKLAPEYRRVAYYTAGTLLLVPIFAAALPHLIGIPGDELPDVTTRIIFPAVTGSLIAALLCLWVHHWRLRVDEEGIHRRRFVRWQSWPWSDFAEGHVLREGDWVTFTFPDSAIGNGALTLALLKGDDTKRIIELIDGVWKPPPMPETASQLHVRVLKGLRILGEIHLASGKIETEWDGRIHAYRWEELRGVSLERTTHSQQGFERLCLSLPDKDLELRVIKQQGNRRPNWVGADAREIVAFLMNHVPEERFRVAALHGPANSLADFEARIARTAKGERESRKIAWIVVGAFAAFGVWLAVKAAPFSNPLEDLSPGLKVLVVVTMLLVAAGPVLMVGIVLTTPRTFRKRRRELEAERERFLEEHRAEMEGAEG